MSFEDVESLQKMRRRPSTKVGDILETFQPRRPTEDAAVGESLAKVSFERRLLNSRNWVTGH